MIEKDNQRFSFETVKVNSRGEIIKREPKSARYFRENLDNNTSLDMVYIPSGTFLMGTDDEEIKRLCQKYDRDWFKSEKPQHQVNLKPFYMSKYPITQGQWKAIAQRTDLKVNEDLELEPSYYIRDPLSFHFANTRGKLDLPYYGDSPTYLDRPVEQVNWYQAQEFCARLCQLTGQEYRLPSEAEWEYACQANTTTPFYFGDTITSDLANYRDTIIYADEPRGVYRMETTPVGMFPPNAFGLYDLHGNVWEWCADTWHENYQNAPSDGSAWIAETRKNVILRGGSCDSDPFYSRSAHRTHDDLWGLIHYPIGFRTTSTLSKDEQFW